MAAVRLTLFMGAPKHGHPARFPGNFIDPVCIQNIVPNMQVPNKGYRPRHNQAPNWCQVQLLLQSHPSLFCSTPGNPLSDATDASEWFRDPPLQGQS
ncbi:hypothetical protein HS088_TW17G00353 [Tripterygium wilfordii]|uniref:Uncharacterized protein n=1 Tax=Tripterygium wilfordii TaxID=458696 RepID=A0A7J7CFF3_TRIWF|nr:hypothetical protein HS088_TW17G00353 [Tripterygium wilfordii]